MLTYGYDSMDRIVEIMGSEGERKSYTYDALGNVTSMTDGEGNTTWYAYTLSGQLAKVTDALGMKRNTDMMSVTGSLRSASMVQREA